MVKNMPANTGDGRRKKKKKKRKQKTIQRILTEKDRVKLSLFADDIKLYIKSRGDDL